MAILKHPEEVKMYNDVLVRAQSETEEFIEGKTLKLHKNITTAMSANSFYHKQKGKRIWAEVVGVPYKLRPIRIHQTNTIYPKAHQSFSGDIIQVQVYAYQKQIKRTLQEKELKVFMDRFRSSPWEPEFTRNDDQFIMCKPGDIAWFHYLALSDDSYMGQDDDHNRYYRVPYEAIYCFEINKGAGVIMVNGYVLIEEYWSKDYEEIKVGNKTIRGKLKGNLVIGIQQSPEYLTGTVIKKGVDFGEDSRPDVKIGDVVIYRKKSEFKNRIMGKEVMVMPQWQIIAKLVGKTFKPVGNYVHLQTTKIPEKQIILMDMVRKEVAGLMMDEIMFKKELSDLVLPIAEVIAVGANCPHVKPGMKVFFNTKAEVFNIEDTIFIREGDIMAEISKSLY